MKLHEFYKICYQCGISNDPRGKKEVRDLLKERKREYSKLPQLEKEARGAEYLNNPYSDTRVLHGKRDRDIEGSIMVGIDISTAELLLADRLHEKGTPIGLVMAHHPQGKAIANLYKVMNMQSDILHHLGVPINYAEGLMRKRIDEVEKSLMPLNVERTTDSARLLDIPFLCCHTPADNFVYQYLTGLMEKEKPANLDEILDLLYQIPEYRKATVKTHTGPVIVNGNKKGRCGKIFVDMTGGTEGAPEAYARLALAGVGTIIGMHHSKKIRDIARENHINMIIAGHMASDAIGMNLILDEVDKVEPQEYISCSGFTRFSAKERPQVKKKKRK